MSQTHITQSPKRRLLLVSAIMGVLLVGAGVLFFAGGGSDVGKIDAVEADALQSAVTRTAVEKGAFRKLSKFARNTFQPSSRQQSPEALSLDRVLHELSLIPSMTPGEQTDARELALVLRWASFQPERACDYAYQAVLDGADESLLKEAVSAWARVDPVAASRWSSRLRSPLLRDIAVSAAYGIWAMKDKAGALGFLKSFSSSAVRYSAWSGVANVSTKNPNAALTWAEKLPGPLREKTLQQVFGSWIRRDPLAAAEWLSNQPMEIQLPLTGRLAAEWTRKDPQAALHWSRAASTGSLTGPQLAAGPLQRRAMDAVLGSFVSSDPESAAAWMTTGAGRPFFSQRVASIASSWASIDPMGAAAWISSIPGGKDRDAAVGALASTWTRADPSEALRWIQGINKSSDRNMALSSFGGTLAGSDPESAAYWSTQISDRSRREETLSLVVSRWRNINPGAATQFVQTSPAAAFLRKKQ